MDDEFIIDSEYGDMCEVGGYREELDTLRAENDRLRDALNAVAATSGKKVFFEEGYKCYDPIQIAKEALK